MGVPMNFPPSSDEGKDAMSDRIEVTYQEDSLFFGKPRPAVSIDCDGEFWIRVDPSTGEIVGLEIEDFESVFLKKHPELQRTWQEAKPLCRNKFRKYTLTPRRSVRLG